MLQRDSDVLVMTLHAVGAAPLWLGGAANCGHSPSGGGVHVHTLTRRVAAPPQVLRNLGVQLQWEGLHDGNVFVGASPVVDYFAFMLENLANSALHRVSGEPLRRCVLRPVDQASNEKQVVERFSCCNT